MLTVSATDYSSVNIGGPSTKGLTETFFLLAARDQDGTPIRGCFVCFQFVIIEA